MMQLTQTEDYQRSVNNFVIKLIQRLSPNDVDWFVDEIVNGSYCSTYQPSELTKQIIFAAQSLYDGSVTVLMDKLAVPLDGNMLSQPTPESEELNRLINLKR